VSAQLPVLRTAAGDAPAKTLYSFGVGRNAENRLAPIAPIIHNYHFFNHNEPAALLAGAFSREFYKNIPAKIQEEIKRTDTTQLDVFVVMQVAQPGSTLPDARLYPQSRHGSIHNDHVIAARGTGWLGNPNTPFDGIFAGFYAPGMLFLDETTAREYIDGWVGKASLKPHYWAYPGMPRLETIGGTVYNEDLRMGLFETEARLSDDLRFEEMNAFPIVVHDARLSGDVAHLNLVEDDLDLAFWTLTLSDRSARAAATLHILVNGATGAIIEREIAALGIGPSPSFSIAEMIRFLRSTRAFQNPKGQAILQKVGALVER
jgi:hypothetical protein